MGRRLFRWLKQWLRRKFRGGGTGVNITGGTPLVVDHYVDSETGTFAGSQINDLIAAIQNKNTRSNSVFYVPFYVVGDSVPRQARVTKANKKVEKFEHQYKAACVVNGTTTNVFYYINDGINLSSMNVANLAGWWCSSNNQLYGNFISGVSGDITLTAEFLGMNATPDKTVLYGGSSVASDKTATITITDADGTVTVDSTSSSLLATDPAVPDASDPSTYTMEITLNDTSMFADDTSANLVLTDGTNTRTVSFVLKNKYTYSITDADNNPCNNVSDVMQGTTLTFAQAKTAVESSGAVPTGRSIVAFKRTAPTPVTVIKEADFPITFNSTNFSARNITLQALLDPTFLTDTNEGGYETTSLPFSSQTGADNTHPYLMNYYGNSTNHQNQLFICIRDHISAASAVTLALTNSALDSVLEITRQSTDHDFIVKIKDGVAVGSVPNDIFTLIATDPATGATKDIYVLIKKNQIIGSKPAPNAVGDIVFNDGSAMSYTDFNGLSTAVQNEKKAAAIALIFYKGTDCNNDGDTTVRTLGVGLKHESGRTWCTDSAAAYSKNITAIQCPFSGSAGAYTFTGDKNGSDNLSQIATFLTSNDFSNDTGTDANYPAFSFAKKYNEQKLGSESSSRIPAGSEFEDGWYLPSLAELYQIYAKGKGANKVFDIDTASNALGGDSFGTRTYWSSSQYASLDDLANLDLAYLIYFTTGHCNNFNKNSSACVCAVRAF